MGKKTKTYCTDKEWWDDLGNGDYDDKCLRAFCKREAAGNVCKKTMAQVIVVSKYNSSKELACFNALYRTFSTLTEEEQAAFGKAYDIGRSRYDKDLNVLLLSDSRFSNNAKIIMLLRRFESGEDVDEDLKKLMTLNISLRRPE